MRRKGPLVLAFGLGLLVAALADGGGPARAPLVLVVVGRAALLHRLPKSPPLCPMSERLQPGIYRLVPHGSCAKLVPTAR